MERRQHRAEARAREEVEAGRRKPGAEVAPAPPIWLAAKLRVAEARIRGGEGLEGPETRGGSDFAGWGGDPCPWPDPAPSEATTAKRLR